MYGVLESLKLSVHPDTFTDPQSCLYQEKYADLSRRPTRSEIKQSYRIAQELGINFEALTFEKSVWGLQI